MVPVNARKHLGLPVSYVGNAMVGGHATASSDELETRNVSEEEVVERLCLKIRDSIAWWTEERVRYAAVNLDKSPVCMLYFPCTFTMSQALRS